MEDGLLKQFGDDSLIKLMVSWCALLQYKYIQTSQGLETGYTE